MAGLWCVKLEQDLHVAESDRGWEEPQNFFVWQGRPGTYASNPLPWSGPPMNTMDPEHTRQPAAVAVVPNAALDEQSTARVRSRRQFRWEDPDNIVRRSLSSRRVTAQVNLLRR